MYIRQYTSRPSFGLGSLTAPFEGTFVGTIAGDASSKAAVSVTLRQQGSAVEGEIALGAGLQFDFGGVCGLEPIDLRSIPIKGQTAAENPMKFTATTEIREPTTKFGATHVVATLSITAVLKSDGQSGTGTIVVTPMRAEPRLPPKPLIGCKPVTRELTLTKQTAAPSAPLQGLGLAPALGPEQWKDLISFVPSAWVQRKVTEQGGKGFPPTPAWFFHKIRDGVGLCNLDYYPVRITQLPTGMRPTALLSHIRKNLNSFIDPNMMRFGFYGEAERQLWLSDQPLGAFLHLDFRRNLGLIAPNVEDGSVVVSDYSPRHWRVYTIWTPQDHGHPLSGVREWGGKKEGNTYIIYTRAADRLTKSMLLPFKADIYDQQHAVWMSFQRLVEAFVNGNGGRAAIEPPTAKRYDWAQLSALYDRGTGWLS